MGGNGCIKWAKEAGDIWELNVNVSDVDVDRKWVKVRDCPKQSIGQSQTVFWHRITF